MKHICQKRLAVYTNALGQEASAHYVTENDILAYHNQKVSNKILEFLKHKSMLVYEDIAGYYYADYKECVMRANSFLYPSN